VVSSSPDRVAEALRTQVPDEQVHTAGPGYDSALALWNGDVDRKPHVVVHCTSTSDVQAAIRVARAADLPISVRGQGHDWAGRALSDGGVTLDLRPMRAVRVDPVRRTTEVGGGASANDVLAGAQAHGLVAATGSIGTVGIAGLTLGGGYGPLMGKLGLAADNLLGAEVVLADGSVVHTDAEHEPELFWALRGGGGNFGIVTSLDLRLHSVPSVVTGMILYPLDQAQQVFAGVREVLTECPDELTVQTGVMTGPDGLPAVVLLPTWCGEPTVAAARDSAVQRLTRLGTPLVAQVAPTESYADTIAERDAMFPYGRSYAMRTRWLRELTDTTVEELVTQAKTRSSALSAFSIHHCHGSASRVPADSTAFPLREPHFMVEIIASWAEAGDGDQHRSWADAASAVLAGYSLDGGYANLLGPEATDQIARAYGRNTERLLAIKANTDPDGVFHAIPLPAN
jgi:FAD/FMN-containing dehydrogenase